MEVCHFRFLFALNKRKLSFSISSVFHLRKHGDMDTWIHGYMETWRHGYMETWIHGYMGTWRHEHGYMGHQTDKRKRRPQRFSSFRLPFAHRGNGTLSFVNKVDIVTRGAVIFKLVFVHLLINSLGSQEVIVSVCTFFLFYKSPYGSRFKVAKNQG